MKKNLLGLAILGIVVVGAAFAKFQRSAGSVRLEIQMNTFAGAAVNSGSLTNIGDEPVTITRAIINNRSDDENCILMPFEAANERSLIRRTVPRPDWPQNFVLPVGDSIGFIAATYCNQLIRMEVITTDGTVDFELGR